MVLPACGLSLPLVCRSPPLPMHLIRLIHQGLLTVISATGNGILVINDDDDDCDIVRLCLGIRKGILHINKILLHNCPQVIFEIFGDLA